MAVHQVVDRRHAEANNGADEVKKKGPPRCVMNQRPILRTDWLDLQPVEIRTVDFFDYVFLPCFDLGLHNADDIH